ncbi:CPBP family intramembrane metalloprotease [Microbacterium sp. ARD31]|uniref:CPBP family intramembrane glutamic endopeptidase n=1 Tax=Microbacterium sp. ARD31 TaxID=2962576 RepID=UPI002880DA9B|nr:CPBP family intramembrane glutamic endopeptidase [Microbacterium sp. ARD31]MDT0185716.1 CPBP family intramembrane metalloprotease [Microbacterium sp. ARD31]
MQDQLSDGPSSPAAEAETPIAEPEHRPDGDERRRRGRRRRRTDWRLGGTGVRPWNGSLLVIALLSLGAAIFAGSLVQLLWRSPSAPLVSTAVLWVGMLVPVVVAFRRGRPAGLLRVRGADLIYGLALGLGLRVIEGWVSDAAARPFPSANLTSSWLLTEAIPSGLVGPVVEEFFFRTVILVAMYGLLRRTAGRAAAAVAAVLVSTASFILIHVVDGSLPLGESLSVGAVGLVCATLVILTGRIWGAVFAHIVYNATALLLMAAGAAISGGQ